MMTEIQSGKQSGAQPARVMSPYVDGMVSTLKPSISPLVM
jgi:hypothetical protein